MTHRRSRRDRWPARSPWRPRHHRWPDRRGPGQLVGRQVATRRRRVEWGAGNWGCAAALWRRRCRGFSRQWNRGIAATGCSCSYTTRGAGRLVARRPRRWRTGRFQLAEWKIHRSGSSAPCASSGVGPGVRGRTGPTWWARVGQAGNATTAATALCSARGAATKGRWRLLLLMLLLLLILVVVGMNCGRGGHGSCGAVWRGGWRGHGTEWGWPEAAARTAHRLVCLLLLPGGLQLQRGRAGAPTLPWQLGLPLGAGTSERELQNQ